MQFNVKCSKEEKNQAKVMLCKLKIVKEVSYMQIIIAALGALLEGESRKAKMNQLRELSGNSDKDESEELKENG